jgi:hypothetical protein
MPLGRSLFKSWLALGQISNPGKLEGSRLKRHPFMII